LRHQYIITYTLLLLFLSLICACSHVKNPPPTADHVNLKRYAGRWYEIASFANRFQKGCQCTLADYQLQNNDTVMVTNRCIKNGQWSQAKGKAWPIQGTDNSKLKVQFFWPFTGNYWIIHVDPHYRYAVVGDPYKRYLWILARKPRISSQAYKRLLNIARKAGYDVETLQQTPTCTSKVLNRLD